MRMITFQVRQRPRGRVHVGTGIYLEEQTAAAAATKAATATPATSSAAAAATDGALPGHRPAIHRQ